MDRGRVVFFVGIALGLLSLGAPADDPDAGASLCAGSCCLLLVGIIIMSSARRKPAYIQVPMMQQQAVQMAPQTIMQPMQQVMTGTPVHMTQMRNQTAGSAAQVIHAQPPLQPLPQGGAEHTERSTRSPSIEDNVLDDPLAEDLSVERREELYEAHLVSALVDGAVSDKEDRHLTEMRRKYKITDGQNDAMVRRLGHDPATLEILKKALAIEESGRYADAAALYEAAGQHERASMLRMKAKAMDNKGNVVQQTTYNIQDSAVTGGIGARDENDES